MHITRITKQRNDGAHESFYVFGIQVENAYKFGMSAMILYTDPEDKGKGEGFPDGMWMSESSVERGNVKTVKGDLYTHLYPAYSM